MNLFAYFTENEKCYYIKVDRFQHLFSFNTSSPINPIELKPTLLISEYLFHVILITSKQNVVQMQFRRRSLTSKSIVA